MTQRAYELMVIIDVDVEEVDNRKIQERVKEMVEAGGGRIAKADVWGRRRYAYPINRKAEGFYVVFEISTPATNLDDLDRFLRLADAVVRHKVVRLPEREAARRGLLEEADAAG